MFLRLWPVIIVLFLLFLVSCTEEVRQDVQAQKDALWNARTEFLKQRADEIALCIERGGVPITQPLYKSDPYRGQWKTPDNARELVRCDFPPVSSLRDDRIER